MGKQNLLAQQLGIGKDRFKKVILEGIVVSKNDRNIHGLLEFHDDRTITTRIDVAFPVLHGKNGEDEEPECFLLQAGFVLGELHTRGHATVSDIR